MRKMLVVPALLSLAVAPNAMALPSDLGAKAQSPTAVPSPDTGKNLVAKPRPKVAVPPQLQAIASCESGANPRSVSSTGQYRGKYQFSRETWAANGGTGDPAAASEAEQDQRAAMLYARSGPGQWPVCGQ